MKKMLLMLMLLVSGISYSETIPALPLAPAIKNDGMPQLPTDTPQVPGLPTEDKVEEGGIRKLEYNTTVMLQSRLKVNVPLEIISDVDIEAMVIDDQKIEVPFDIELNKEPEIKDYYKIKYSETEIDIDKDGAIDTRIYSPKFLNTRIIEDNIVYIDGAKISKEGTHKKKVYMTIEVKE